MIDFVDQKPTEKPQRAEGVVSAMKSLGERNLLGENSPKYAEMGDLIPHANKKAPVLAAVDGVLKKYGDRQDFGALISDGHSNNPSDNTKKTIRILANKVDMCVTSNPELHGALQMAKAERAASFVMPVRTTSDMRNVDGSFVRNDNVFAGVKDTEIKLS
jgi:hypothetical protein